MTFVLIKLSYPAGLVDSDLSYNVIIMSENQMHRADSSNRSYKSLLFDVSDFASLFLWVTCFTFDVPIID